MRDIVVLVFVGLAAIGAYQLAGWLRPVKERDAEFAARRDALLGGTLRDGRHGLPLAVVEVRGASGLSVLLASHPDDAVARLEGGSGNAVKRRLFEPQGEAGRLRVEAFHAELRRLAAAPVQPTVDDPPPATVTLHLRRDGRLHAALAGPLDAVRAGAHPLSEAYRLARAVNGDVFRTVIFP